MKLTETQRMTITEALRIAATQYEKDRITVSSVDSATRLVDQFRLQEKRAIDMFELIENADSVEVTP